MRYKVCKIFVFKEPRSHVIPGEMEEFSYGDVAEVEKYISRIIETDEVYEVNVFDYGLQNILYSWHKSPKIKYVNKNTII